MMNNQTHREMTDLRKTQQLYHDLIMAVGNKHPGETRHQTAKRYIIEAESLNTGSEEASQVRHNLGLDE